MASGVNRMREASCRKRLNGASAMKSSASPKEISFAIALSQPAKETSPNLARVQCPRVAQSPQVGRLYNGEARGGGQSVTDNRARHSRSSCVCHSEGRRAEESRFPVGDRPRERDSHLHLRLRRSCRRRCRAVPPPRQEGGGRGGAGRGGAGRG